MQNIKISRLKNHPQGYQGIIDSGAGWKVAIDAEGKPHLYVKVDVDGQEGWLNTDDLFDNGMTPAWLIGAKSEGVTEEEMQGAEIDSTFVCPLFVDGLAT